jgi:hypothetical protein
MRYFTVWAIKVFNNYYLFSEAGLHHVAQAVLDLAIFLASASLLLEL